MCFSKNWVTSYFHLIYWWNVKTVINSFTWAAIAQAYFILMIQFDVLNVKNSIAYRAWQMRIFQYPQLFSPAVNLLCWLPVRGGNSWPFRGARGLGSRSHSSALPSRLCWLFFIVWCLGISQTASSCFLKLKVCFSWEYTMLVGLVFVFLHFPSLLLQSILCFLLINRKEQSYQLCTLVCVRFSFDSKNWDGNFIFLWATRY